MKSSTIILACLLSAALTYASPIPANFELEPRGPSSTGNTATPTKVSQPSRTGSSGRHAGRPGHPEDFSIDINGNAGGQKPYVLTRDKITLDMNGQPQSSRNHPGRPEDFSIDINGNAGGQDKITLDMNGQPQSSRNQSPKNSDGKQSNLKPSASRASPTGTGHVAKPSQKSNNIKQTTTTATGTTKGWAHQTQKPVNAKNPAASKKKSLP
ncbi:hypothetical protein H0H92_006628 [Tricholoma furcatifolium]|nr:hypothetical protein H0H92_006628 [Tricholoma furcatifolium]